MKESDFDKKYKRILGALSNLGMDKSSEFSHELSLKIMLHEIKTKNDHEEFLKWKKTKLMSVKN